MKRNSFFAAGIASLAMMVSACSGSSNPASSTGGTVGGSRTENPGILARLSNPSVELGTISGESYNVMFVAGASGTPDSEPMIAARTISTVDFEFYAANGAIVSRSTARDVYTTGVVREDQVGSLTVVGESSAPVASVRRSSYVVAIVRGHNGETLIRRADIPDSDS